MSIWSPNNKDCEKCQFEKIMVKEHLKAAIGKNCYLDFLL